jgi:hypothetical protein
LQRGSNTAISRVIPMLLEILNLILGIAFGFIHKGREDYYGLLKNGVIAGLILGIIFVLAAQYLLPKGLSVDFGFLGAAGFFIEIFLFLVIFIIGTFAGDWLERVIRK